jgi:hypothetical protein
MLLKIPLSCFYQTVFLVSMLFFLLSGCCIFYLWIPEAVEDLLSSCPCFIVYHSDTFYFSSSECNIFDLWILEAVEDLLSSCPCFIVYHSNAFYFSSCLNVASLIYGLLRW